MFSQYEDGIYSKKILNICIFVVAKFMYILILTSLLVIYFQIVNEIDTRSERNKLENYHAYFFYESNNNNLKQNALSKCIKWMGT